VGQEPMDSKPRVVIVGGGFGGLAAARALARADAEVLLIDKQNHHLFQPLLYQVATAALSPANIAAPIRKIVSRQRNCQVIMAEVTDIDRAARTVTIVDRRYRYDYLVLAAGVRTNYFGHDQWAGNAPGLKTVDEAIEVRCRFLVAFEQAELETDPQARRAALTFAIVGAGPTGVEMAGAIAEISRHTLRRDFRLMDTSTVRVILIDASDRVLPSFNAELSLRARRDLETLGVETMLHTLVVDVDEGGVTVERGGTKERIEANNVFWAAGVEAVAIGGKVGAEADSMGRVIVDDDLSVPGDSSVFVIGDLAHRVDPQTAEPVPGVAQGAIQMGHFAGRTIAAELVARRRGEAPPDRGVFVYKDKGMMATIGRNRAVADVKGLRFGGVLAFLAWAFVHVLSLITFRSRFSTLAEWTWMYFFYERGVRLITGERWIPRPVKPPRDPRLDDR
jgi:NADH dehydrogenase